MIRWATTAWQDIPDFFGYATSKTPMISDQNPAAEWQQQISAMRQRRPSQSELLSGPLVDVYVGATRKHWCLHRNILCHHSEYFRSELGGDKKPNLKPSKIELLEDDPAAFEYLVKWLYQGTIDDVSDIPMEKKWDHADTCQKLYLLCDRVKLPNLKNIAIDQFRKGCNEASLVPGAEEMQPIYDKTPVGSPFRRLISKIAARQIMDPDSDRDASTYQDVFKSSPEFAIDVINAIRNGSGGKLYDDPTEGDHCTYHDHPNGERCKKKVEFKGLNGLSSPKSNGSREESPKINGITKPSNLKMPKTGAHKQIPQATEFESPAEPKEVSQSVSLVPPG
ncbi:putative btb poz-like protein [Phaeomoniella chlamydospora]|uniref:Putative btb poz-like protein n=1 Tax=Phaeomoniella chlamydospora TaxID=158046 RepID=A0A0G2EZR7_PHACM|nr:putative btb poz-like protein [Phaeomoniella chlamydospora]